MSDKSESETSTLEVLSSSTGYGIIVEIIAVLLEVVVGGVIATGVKVSETGKAGAPIEYMLPVVAEEYGV